ncbi:MAG: hypothetical protein KJ915_05585 [Candidatus Omnitrophica bacterium]|nr:hypothetical protein [Candidatus Omnitrophota bacterium]
MQISKLFISIIISIFCLFLVISSSYCQEAVHTVSGNVSSLSSAGQLLSINYTDQTNSIQNVQLVIGEDTEFFDLPDIYSLHIGDDITVDYIIDEQGDNQAVSLYKFAAK